MINSTSFPAYKYLTEFPLDSPPRINSTYRGRSHPGVFENEVTEFTPPLRNDEGSIRVNGIAMIFGFFKVANFAIMFYGSPGCGFPRIPWDGKNMRTTRPYGPGNFCNGFRGIEQMFQHVLCDDQIKGVVGKCLIFQVLAPESLGYRSWKSVRVIVCGQVPTAVLRQFLGRSTTWRRFMDSVTTPLREMGVQDMNDCALPGYAQTTKAPEVIA
jgi:hypothetical protein